MNYIIKNIYYKFLNSKNITYNKFVDAVNEALDKCKKTIKLYNK